MKSLEILYEDNHLLVVNKPAGIATMGAAEGEVTLHSIAAKYLREKYHKPGNAFVGIVSRLDTVTSGLVVLARTSKAASRLVPQFADHSDNGALKLYLAVVEGDIAENGGEWCDFVRKDDAAHRMRVVSSEHTQAKTARLRFAVLHRTENESLLAVRLLTGRKHQIRLQAAERGYPIVGDRKYGSNRQLESLRGVALHSWRLQIKHPTRQEAMSFEASVPECWRTGFPAVCIPANLSADDRLRLQIPF